MEIQVLIQISLNLVDAVVFAAIIYDKFKRDD